MKQYIANTPLILQDENGVDVRIERGAVVVLSDTQYAEVAAHVTPIDESETANATMSSHLEDEPSETLPENSQPETVEPQEQTSDTTTKPKRGKAQNAE